MLNEVENAVHQKVIAMRDQAFAHSDALSHEIEAVDYGGSKVKVYKSAFNPLTIKDTRLLRHIVLKWIGHLEALRVAAKQQQ